MLSRLDGTLNLYFISITREEIRKQMSKLATWNSEDKKFEMFAQVVTLLQNTAQNETYGTEYSLR